MKICRWCKVPKEEAEFNKQKANKDGLHSLCKDCRKVYREENRLTIALKKAEHYRKNQTEIAAKQSCYYKKNRKKILAKKKVYEKETVSPRNRYVLYGVTPDEFKRALAEQGGVCAICSGPGDKRGLCVDHDHESGKFRALLCGKCNTAIGYLKDSSAVAQLAVDYLKRHGK